MEYQAPNTLQTQEYTCGVCVLFDVIGSTTMKRKYKESWRTRFEEFYSTTGILVSNLQAVCGTLSAEPVLKNLGDGVMIFLPMELKQEKVGRFLEKDRAWLVFDTVLEFWRHLESVFPLLQVRVKTVVTALNDIYYVKPQGAAKADVLGRGIDFTFRLEKFGDSSHYVVNKAFYDALTEDKVRMAAYLGAGCFKQVKGWDDPQTFHILTTPEMIEATYTDRNPDPHSDNVYLELFKVYLDQKVKDQENQIVGEIKKEMGL